MATSLEEQVYKNKSNSGPKKALIILAGATGDLGLRIAQNLLQRGANVRALVRQGSNSAGVTSLRQMGAAVVEVDFNNEATLTEACSTIKIFRALRRAIAKPLTEKLMLYILIY